MDVLLNLLMMMNDLLKNVWNALSIWISLIHEIVYVQNEACLFDLLIVYRMNALTMIDCSNVCQKKVLMSLMNEISLNDLMIDEVIVIANVFDENSLLQCALLSHDSHVICPVSIFNYETNDYALSHHHIDIII